MDRKKIQKGKRRLNYLFIFAKKLPMSVRKHMKFILERKIARFLLKLIGLLILASIVVLLGLFQNSI